MATMMRTRYRRSDGRGRKRGSARVRAILACVAFMPLTLAFVSGCALSRSCAVGRAGDVSRGAAALSSPREIGAPGTGISSAGVFTESPDENVTGCRAVLRGSVVAAGNEPHIVAVFVLEDGTGTYVFYPDARGREALALQGRLVEITAIIVDRAFESPSGSSSGDGIVYPLSWKIVN